MQLPHAGGTSSETPAVTAAGVLWVICYRGAFCIFFYRVQDMHPGWNLYKMQVVYQPSPLCVMHSIKPKRTSFHTRTGIVANTYKYQIPYSDNIFFGMRHFYFVAAHACSYILHILVLSCIMLHGSSILNKRTTTSPKHHQTISNSSYPHRCFHHPPPICRRNLWLHACRGGDRRTERTRVGFHDVVRRCSKYTV